MAKPPQDDALRHWLLDMLAVISPIAMAATCVCWARSYFLVDSLDAEYSRPSQNSTTRNFTAETYTFDLEARRGRLQVRFSLQPKIVLAESASASHGAMHWWTSAIEDDELRTTEVHGDAALLLFAAPPRRAWKATFSFGWIAGVTLLSPAIKFSRRLKRAASDRCRQCGYDMRATPDRCPECGTSRLQAVL